MGPVKIQHRDRDAKMPMVKLTYFDLEGRGELIRLLLHAGNIDFEDFRFGFGEWAKHKPNTPFGSVPVLTWDEEEMAQTMAIVRFVARKVGMAGKTDKEFLPKWLAPLETILKKRGGEWYSGSGPTYADLAMLDKYPLVKANYQRTCALPTSISWKAKKPAF